MLKKTLADRIDDLELEASNKVEEIKSAVVALRKEQGITVKEVSNITKIQSNTMFKYMMPEANPTIFLVVKILQAIGYDLKVVSKEVELGDVLEKDFGVKFKTKPLLFRTTKDRDGTLVAETPFGLYKIVFVKKIGAYEVSFNDIKIDGNPTLDIDAKIIARTDYETRVLNCLK